MKNYRDYIPVMNTDARPEDYGIYPRSIRKVDDVSVFMADAGDKDILVIVGGRLGFSGESVDVNGKTAIVAPLTHETALRLHELFPFTSPVRVLGKKRSVGVGDRLGIASPGHIRVFNDYDAYPILAQQSVREITLTQRTFEDVLDSATFAVYREGFERGYGADGDHLKSFDEVKHALELGFTMITLDCSEHMHNEYEALSDDEVSSRYIPDAGLEQLYQDKTFDIGEGVSVTIPAPYFKRMLMVYRDVLDFAERIYHSLFAPGTYDADLEISIDETSTPTTPQEHFLIASELERRGVKVATLAPRFCGEFQKGIDYIGDLKQFESELVVHAAIARRFGYKLSLHSGSDKFSVFPIFGRLTQGNFHVKTAGTNWLEAMKLVSMVDPKLYREIHAFALEKFPEVTRYYHVTTDITRIPALGSLSDDELPSLFSNPDARQLIHITYGPILTEKNADGAPRFKSRLYSLWREHAGEYSDMLYAHIGHHLELLYKDIPR